MGKPEIELGKLARKARVAGLRLRVRDALAGAALVLPVPLLFAVGALTAIKVLQPNQATERVLTGIGIALLVLALAYLAYLLFRSRPAFMGAQVLDRHHQTSDRVSSALNFAQYPAGERTPMMDAAIADARQYVDKLRPRKAVPLRPPLDLLVSVGLAVVVVGIAQLEVRTEERRPTEVSTFQPMAMNPDDVELLREMSERLPAQSEDPEVMAAVRRFNQLVEDIADRRIDRRQVFERLEELERAILAGEAADDEALDEGLDGVAQALKESKLTKPVAEALEDKRLEDAEAAMRKLAERLSKQEKVNQAELERLRKALAQASKSSSERMERLEQRRRALEEERRSLLKKKQEQKQPNKSLDKQIEKNRRKLERLSREKNRADRAAKKMSQLDRDLAKAAADLMRDMGKGAQGLEQSAESLNRMAQKELSRKEKQELLKRLKELRDLMRQQGKGGQQRMQRLLKFGQRARGGGEMKPGGKGDQGSQKKTLLLKGQGQGRGIPIPTPGAPSPASGSMPGGQEGGSQAGEQWGSSEGPEVKGDTTDLKGETKDVAAAGVDTGQGPSASEVVYGAAERGFVGRGYQKVYTEYHTVAEQVIQRDEIPPGYKFYVRRYFQLIRPRE